MSLTQKYKKVFSTQNQSLY